MYRSQQPIIYRKIKFQWELNYFLLHANVNPPVPVMTADFVLFMSPENPSVFSEDTMSYDRGTVSTKPRVRWTTTTLGPAYNELGYSEHPAVTSRFLCAIFIDASGKKVGYNEHLSTMSCFFCILLLIVSGNQRILI